MNEPQLFVICNNCGSEVSPYVTECPYCGKRLRKRAPDLPKNRDKERVKRQLGFRGSAKPGKQARRFKPKLSFETSRPKATIALILISVVVSIATRVGGFPVSDLIATEPVDGRWWTLLTAPFFHPFGYGFIALVAVAIFGSSLEERLGPLQVAGLWVVAGAAGVGAQFAMPGAGNVAGASAIALAMLVTWVAVVQSRDEEFDRYGVLAIGAALLALPLVSPYAGVGAATAGLIVGFASGLWFGRRSRANN